jgi:hypothetical protein
MHRGSSTVPAALLVLSLVVVAAVAVTAGTPFANLLTDPPEVSLDVDEARGAGPDEAAATVTFTHAGGDALPAANLYVVVDGERVAARENLTLSRSAPTFDIGERIVVEQTGERGLTGGEELALVYERGDTAFRLRAVTVPE